LHPKIWVGIAVLLEWLALGATVLAAERLVALVWPTAMGFAALSVRFCVAPVRAQMYVHAGILLIVCLLAPLFSHFATTSSVLDAVMLRSGHEWALAVLALGYGGLGGTLFGALASRVLRIQCGPELAELFSRSDDNPFWITTERKTSPILIAVAIGLVIALVVLVKGWWPL
jgi:hypothetical protein